MAGWVDGWWAEGEGKGLSSRAEGEGFVESKTLLSQRLNARPGGEYGFSSLTKQNKKGKKCAVFCFAGKRKILFVYL